MTEVTRVPLQPIAKGALTKLWLGVLAVALAAAGLAWASLPKSVGLETVKAGTGKAVTTEDVVVINYVGKLTSGKTFDEGQQAPLPVAGMIPGFTEGLLKMKQGGKYKLTIPAVKAYGPEEKRNPQSGEVVIPANSDLVFDIEILQVVPRPQFEAMMQMQQQQQMQGGAEAPSKDAPKSTPKTK
jgi:FKBP-type peptidyl-prolyl cis-trans isomerase FkpA